MELILNDLKNYSDRIFCIPLNEEEIFLLEEKVNLIFSETFKKHLKTFGIYQDVIPELVKTEKEFISLCDDILLYPKKDFIPLADTLDGKWLLENSSDKIFIWEYWIEDDFFLKLLYSSYEGLINNSIKKIQKNYHNLIPNKQKVWRVQFTIATQRESFLLYTLSASKETDWIIFETSPAGVTTFIAEITFNHKKALLNKLEYVDWDSPIYSLDYEEPIEALLSDNSVIKYYNILLKKIFTGYSLVDYGIVIK